MPLNEVPKFLRKRLQQKIMEYTRFKKSTTLNKVLYKYSKQIVTSLPGSSLQVNKRCCVVSGLSCCRSLALGQQYSSLGSQPILCGSIPGLVPKQLRFCRNYIEIMPSVAEGVKLGIQECQHQFRGRRWNCTTIEDNLAIFGPVLDKGEKHNCLFLLLGVPMWLGPALSHGMGAL